MTPEELAVVRGRLEEFAVEVFAPLARSDRWGEGQVYLRGLLLDGRRKSMQPMAARLGVDHQGLQQGGLMVATSVARRPRQAVRGRSGSLRIRSLSCGFPLSG